MEQDPQDQDRKEMGKPKERAMPTTPDGVCATRGHVTSATHVISVVGTTKRLSAQGLEERRAKKEEKVKKA